MKKILIDTNIYSHAMRGDHYIPGVPGFIDSPLGFRITRLYQLMEDFWDQEANESL